jgi:hypothetical protein
MAASGSLARDFSAVFPARNSQSQNDQSVDHAAEVEVSLICARAGVSYIGIAADRVLFQPVVATLSIPLDVFADPARAIALIRSKLAEVQP